MSEVNPAREPVTASIMVSRKKEENSRNAITRKGVFQFFKGIGFYIGRKGPELFSKTIERLGLYISTQFKNGSDIKNA